MVIRLEGHDCRHAVEQALLSWLPDRERIWSGALPETGDSLISRLFPEDNPPRAYARLRLDGVFGEGEAQLEGPWPEKALLCRRAEQRLVKTALYRALTACTGEELPWGALTGVRPAKLASRLLGETEEDRDRAAEAMERIYSLSTDRARLCVDAGLVSRRMSRELEDRDGVLYLGIPFCPSRCAYCSFVSHSVEKSLALVEPYVDALCRELEGTAELVRESGLRLRAFYMGGGTPTTLSAAQLDRVLGRLRERFDWSACGEWTVEAGRPDTLDREKLAVLAKHGTDRISINPQTMEDRVLAAIGRKHSAAEIEACFHLAREVFPGQINMDLIAGLPEDTEAGFARSLDRVLALDPENITVHSLTRKRGADLNNRDGVYPDGAEVSRMLDRARAQLTASGYRPYYLYRQKYSAGGLENIGWAKPGTECLYNVCMMEELCHVLSLGAGGVTKRLWRSTGAIRRAVNKKYPKEYLDSPEDAVARKRSLFLEP